MSKIEMVVTFLVLVAVATLPSILFAIFVPKQRDGWRYLGKKAVLAHYLWCVLTLLVTFLLWQGEDPWGLLLVGALISGVFLLIPVAGGTYALFNIRLGPVEEPCKEEA